VNIRLIRRIPSPFPYLPKPLREVEKPPAFGRRLYEVIGKSKILLNVATDISGDYRVNMRCFEAMGCGACMLSDEGIYPDGMVTGQNLVTYKGPEDALSQIEALIREPERARTIGREAASMIASRYSKSKQWKQFEVLVAAL
jgi:spore maturation protein CgeB